MARKRKINGKKQMTEDQEFQIMKLVLDKFLWLGFIVMGWGMYVAIRDTMMFPGLWYMIGGAVLLFLFLVIIVKEYEILK
ncbi:hypothetical protein HOE37_04945 [Candidatus Woesearchaeota archaeon]|jgi:hypothetical protein|nr:hypothetical protein [Candidatus Woesearchaeota archaeon]MBT4111179.1 hypothetical protein [Candidatus Woesearchaeota archaeon]MBT4336760.1 hypothetical protein [Candidatus Woesearchaeota archaeon]MBT4469428.1 hypothetical protein [Candidatus Woesearchaeota archaeon]MBT6744177.1 hypothetical protein [Candidatus Woesearchaeota archaeon]